MQPNNTMAHYLYTVREVWGDATTLTLADGIRMSELTAHPETRNFIQGIALELRFPDGSKHRTFLLNYGVGALRQDDGSLMVEQDPLVRFTLPADLSPEDVPVGTEVWWLTEEAGKTPEEITVLLAEFYG